MNSIQFGKGFLLMDDRVDIPLTDRGLARQAQENFQTKNPQTRVTLHENKPGEGLLYRGSQFYLLTDDTLDAFQGLQQQSRAQKSEATAKAQARPNLQELKKQLAKLEGDRDSAVAIADSMQYSTTALEGLKEGARKAASLQSREAVKALQTQLTSLKENERTYLDELFDQPPQQALQAEINGLKQQAAKEAEAKFGVKIERLTLAIESTKELLRNPPSYKKAPSPKELASNLAKQEAALKQLSEAKTSHINHAKRGQITKLDAQIVNLNQAALQLASEKFAPQIAALEAQIETVKADALKTEVAKLTGEIQAEEAKAATRKDEAKAGAAGRYTGQIDALKAKIAAAETALPPELPSLLSLDGIQQRVQQGVQDFKANRSLSSQIQALLAGATPLNVHAELNVKTPLMTKADGVGKTRKSLGQFLYSRWPALEQLLSEDRKSWRPVKMALGLVRRFLEA